MWRRQKEKKYVDGRTAHGGRFFIYFFVPSRMNVSPDGALDVWKRDVVEEGGGREGWGGGKRKQSRGVRA